jgi:hypothetical protein
MRSRKDLREDVTRSTQHNFEPTSLKWTNTIAQGTLSVNNFFLNTNSRFPPHPTKQIRPHPTSLKINPRRQNLMKHLACSAVEL